MGADKDNGSSVAMARQVEARAATEHDTSPDGVEGSGDPPPVSSAEGAENTSADESVNTVLIRGRVSADPQERQLPSGASIATVRVAMRRQRTAMTTGSRALSDWMDCVAWTGRTRRSVLGWRPGDLVEVEGALRRRFYRAGAGVSVRVEVEVTAARVVRRG